MSYGIILECKIKSQECKYKCCKFADNYIVLYPGEFENSKLEKNHLEIIDEDYFGGKKAVCIRKCEQKDFKPLDCKSYPLFPTLNNGGNIILLNGMKCPLSKIELIEHKKWVLDFWNNLIRNKEIVDWLKKVKLVGYSVLE